VAIPPLTCELVILESAVVSDLYRSTVLFLKYVQGSVDLGCSEYLSSQVKFIFIAHFIYKIIQSALYKIKALKRRVEEALKIHKRTKRKK